MKLLCPAPFLTELSATVTRPAWLVSIGFSSPVYLCSAGDVSWNGYAWQNRLMKISGLSADGSGGQSGTLTISNYDDAIGAALLNERAADRAIVIYAAWTAEDGTQLVRQVFSGVGSSAQVGAKECSIALVSGASRVTNCPRKMINSANGFSRLKPEGSKITWNGQVYTLERKTA